MIEMHMAAMTGRSGSGKSTASTYLADLGFAVIDGDVLARKVVQRGTACLADLVDAFGESILLEDGSLNRRLLGEICFSDAESKARLNGIVHPYITQELFHEMEILGRQGRGYCVVEAPALMESGLVPLCDRIILITAPEELLLQRIMRRDNLTEHQARSRLASQTPEEEVRSLCDMIIDNDGTPEEFRLKLDALADQLDRWFH